MLTYHPLRLVRRDEVADDAVCLSFEVPDALRNAFAYRPGQHIGVKLALDGVNARRTYSIVDAPGANDLLRIGVRVHPQGRMSQHLAQGLRVGDTLEVLPPNGGFHATLDAGRARRYVAFAAGSGITPILSILASILGGEPQSRCTLFYGNRSTAHTMFADEVLDLKDRFLDRFAAHFVMSREPQEVDLLNGRLDAEKVRACAGVLFDPREVDEYFVCGPDTLVADVTRALEEIGARGRIHSELFGTPRAAPARAPDAAAEAAPSSTASVTVVVDGRRRHFTMPLGAESILDAAARAGIDLPYSCRAGVCSTCRTKVVRGKVDMVQNYALEDWELAAGFVLCCQSRPATADIEINYDER